MRTHSSTALSALFALPMLATLVGCASTSSYVKGDDTTLGRVVLYRNGVAYFERTADVKDDTLKLAVPADKVDDFLKSLTVVDAATGKPAPIAYPTDVPRDGTGLIDMKIHLPEQGPHKLRLSYVTEAPAWKPSYRIVVDDAGKLDLQGWAIVDNTSGEDWNRVKLGVGSSSALSFRFDLRSVRSVQRETLQADGLFAIAPPMGGSTFGGTANGAASGYGYSFTDDVLSAPIVDAPKAAELAMAAPPPAAAADHARPRSAVASPASPPPVPRKSASAGGASANGPAADMQIASIANSLRGSGKRVQIQGYASASDADKGAASLDRANRLRDRLVQYGVAPSQLDVVGKADVVGKGGARIVDEAEEQGDKKAADAGKPGRAVDKAPLASDPIGTSHFESGTTMTVPKASSAMVSILNAKTEGGVVYLYDPESARGNANYAFRSVRLVNPTDSVLESGPVTVFGKDKFIGEGLSEPMPAHAASFVPFALDRQVVVERKDSERDEIARILTVQRGVFSTEVKHLRRAQFTLHNRLGERAVVYVRQTLPEGYTLENAPPSRERMGNSDLFRVELEPHASKDVVIESGTPVMKTLDLRTPGSFETVRAYLSSGATGVLKDRVSDLAKMQMELDNIEQRIQSTRDQMAEHRSRLDELHAQIVTLKVVKSGGPLMQSLEKKMQETSDRVSKATIDLVGLEEKLMVARIKFQDGVAELSLDDKKNAVAETTPPAPSSKGGAQSKVGGS